MSWEIIHFQTKYPPPMKKGHNQSRTDNLLQHPELMDVDLPALSDGFKNRHRLFPSLLDEEGGGLSLY